MTLPKFREIVAKEYLDSMPVTNKHSTWNILHATNKLLWYSRNYPYHTDSTKYEYTVNGIKTGFTNEAGFSLISSAVDNNGTELISVIMDVREINGNKGIFTYSKELLKYGFENFKKQAITNKGIVTKKVSVANTSDKNSLDLVTSDRVDAILPIDSSSWSIEKKEHLDLPIKAPIKKGDVLGSIEFFRDGIILGKTNLIAARSVHESLASQTRRITKKAAGNQFLVNMLKIISIFLITLIILRVILRKISRAINTKKRKTNGINNQKR